MNLVTDLFPTSRLHYTSVGTAVNLGAATRVRRPVEFTSGPAARIDGKLRV